MNSTSLNPCATARHAFRQSGFTMTEMLVTLTIIAVLAGLTGIAVPSLVASTKAKAATSDLMVSFAKARSLAITRNTNVTVVPGNGGWASGWQVVDCGTNSVVDNHAPVSAISVSGPSGSVVYNPSGRLQPGSTPPTFVVSGQSSGNTAYRCLSIELSGRPYTKAGQSC